MRTVVGILASACAVAALVSLNLESATAQATGVRPPGRDAAAGAVRPIPSGVLGGVPMTAADSAIKAIGWA